MDRLARRLDRAAADRDPHRVALRHLFSVIALWASCALAPDRRRPCTLAASGITPVVMVTSSLLQVPPGGLR